eukprot:10696275-Alexandrium_andersonii.AAC.1
MDPDLGSYRQDAPTASRAGKYLLAATAAEKRWPLFTLDAHTAFLSGDKSERPAPLYFEPPADLRAGMGLAPWEVLVLEKAAYGLSEAPRAWWRRLRRKAEESGFSGLQSAPA